MNSKDDTLKDFRRFFLKRYVLLISGTVLISLADMRGGIGLLAWFAPVPFLLYAINYTGKKNSLLLFITILIAAHLSLLKMITPPIPIIMTPMFAIPAGVTLWLLYTIWSKLYHRTGPAFSIGTYVALLVIFEWVQSFTSEMGVWGTLAHSQLQNLPLLQLASITGMLGISAIMAWIAGIIAVTVQNGINRPLLIHWIAFSAVIIGVLLYGNIRILSSQDGPYVRVAAVTSDYIPSGKLPDGDDPVIIAETNRMFKRSSDAASMGAKFVVWNEGSTLIEKTDESAFIKRAQSWAIDHKTSLIAAYIVPLPNEERKFENKYIWIDPDGIIAEEYFKHHPVPGEGSIQGIDKLEAVETKYGKMAGAICYDYDFPHISLEHARLGAGIVMLPSSDWRGIDPQHTMMTRVRAIEGGFSILRSVRAATSMGFDAYGRIRGSLPYFEQNDRILVVSLPTQKISTLYSRTGDLLPYLAVLYLIYSIVLILKGRKEG